MGHVVHNTMYNKALAYNSMMFTFEWLVGNNDGKLDAIKITLLSSSRSFHSTLWIGHPSCKLYCGSRTCFERDES